MFSYINCSAEISMCISAFFCVLFAFFGRFKDKLANVFLLFAIVIAVFLTYKQIPNQLNLFNGFCISDTSIIAKRMTMIIAGIVFFLILGIKEQNNNPESYAMYSISILGILVSISSSNLIAMYVGLELQVIPLYFLSSMSCNLIKSSDAAVKYYVFGIVSSAIMLMGISFIYCAVQTLDFADAGNIVANFEYGSGSYSFFIFGFICFLLGFCFKLVVFPAYFWAPDVYQNSRTSFVLFISSVPKIGNVFLLSNIVDQMVSKVFHYDNLVYVFLFIGFVSVLLGSLGAISQLNFRRFIAYSSVNAMGLVFALIPSFIDVKILIGYLFVYSILLIGVFACIISVCNEEENLSNMSLADLNILFKKNTLIYLIILSLLFSMAGVPPFAGFVSKLYLFFILIKNWSVIVVICLISLSLLSIYYYLNAIFQICFYSQKNNKIDTVADHNSDSVSVSRSRLAMIVAFGCFIVNCTFVFYPSFVFIGLNF